MGNFFNLHPWPWGTLVNQIVFENENVFWVFSNVADPGSDAFLTLDPGSRTDFFRIPDPKLRIFNIYDKLLGKQYLLKAQEYRLSKDQNPYCTDRT